MATSSPLETLPIEIQWAIIRQLDPVALIAISQTNKHYRETVKPNRTHFVERLLALECDEAIGGPPVKFLQFGAVHPDRLSAEWEANRWACSRCMRLLPYHRFATPALSRVAYRKPVPGSPAAAQQAVTSWEPVQWRQRRKKDGKKGQDSGKHSISDGERQMRRRYGVAMSRYWGQPRRDGHGTILHDTELTKRFDELREMGFEEFEEMTFNEYQAMPDSQEIEIWDRERQAIELLRSGWKRRIRRCLECRFQRGELRGSCGPENGNLGTVNVPIVPQGVRHSCLRVDRFFPGLSEVLDMKRPDVNSPVFVVYREDADTFPWPQYRVRCPGCGQWKEMHAFRFGLGSPRWKPMITGSEEEDYRVYGSSRFQNWDETLVTEELVDGLRCNHCFAAANGREALGQALMVWLLDCVKIDEEIQKAGLVLIFRSLHFEYTRMPKKAKGRAKELLRDLQPLLNQDKSRSSRFTRADAALFGHRYAQWRAQSEPIPGWQHNRLWVKERFERYPDTEALWSWLHSVTSELEEPGKAEALADWALSKDE